MEYLLTTELGNPGSESNGIYVEDSKMTKELPPQDQDFGSKKPDDEKVNALSRFFDWVVSTEPEKVSAYVDKLRSQNPGISDDNLAKKIVSRKTLKNGLVGGITGIPGILSLPVTIPADLVASWRIQAFMAMCVAYVYGHTAETTDLKTDLYLIFAGDSAKEALKRIGIEVGKTLTKKGVQKYITREVMKKIWSVLGRKIITKAGEKSLTSFMRMVPLVGGVIGFGFDWAYARTVGKFAIKYYSGRG
jgi:hypothetical protein